MAVTHSRIFTAGTYIRGDAQVLADRSWQSLPEENCGLLALAPMAAPQGSTGHNSQDGGTSKKKLFKKKRNAAPQSKE